MNVCICWPLESLQIFFSFCELVFSPSPHFRQYKWWWTDPCRTVGWRGESPCSELWMHCHIRRCVSLHMRSAVIRPGWKHLAFVILMITREKPGVWFKYLQGDLTDQTEEKTKHFWKFKGIVHKKCHYLLILVPFQIQMLFFSEYFHFQWTIIC